MYVDRFSARTWLIIFLQSRSTITWFAVKTTSWRIPIQIIALGRPMTQTSSPQRSEGTKMHLLSHSEPDSKFHGSLGCSQPAGIYKENFLPVINSAHNMVPIVSAKVLVGKILHFFNRYHGRQMPEVKLNRRGTITKDRRR